jgi:3-phosphoshikimate 1-carboxyvinyltransferase
MQMRSLILAAYLTHVLTGFRFSVGLVRSSALQMVEKLHLQPINKISGEFTLPGSKSLSNRVLLLSALSTGNTLVENLLDSADIRYMVGALQQLKIPLVEDKEKMTASLVGNGGAINVDQAELFLGNAGTAMRPLAGVLCAGKGTFVLDGTPRMRERPIIDLVDGLKQVRLDIFI